MCIKLTANAHKNDFISLKYAGCMWFWSKMYHVGNNVWRKNVLSAVVGRGNSVTPLFFCSDLLANLSI